MNIRNLKLAGAMTLAVLAGSTANATDAMVSVSPVLSNEIRLGMYFLQYDVKADDLSGPYVPPGVNIGVKSNSTVYFAYVRRLAPNWVVQIAAGIPPKTETVGKGPPTLGSVPFDGQVVSSAKWFSPTLIAAYVFRDETETWRPYLGAGINYTKFYDLQSTAAGNAANGGPTAISLTSSLGPAVTAGIRWHFNDHWNAYLSYDYAMINSDYTGNTAGVIRRTSVKFNPTAVVASVGYYF